VGADESVRLRHGGAIPWSGDGEGELVNPIAVIDDKGLIGIGEIQDGYLAPKKILVTAEDR